MQGREYLALAREWVTGTLERHWRGAVGRAYYALFLECRDTLSRWGFHPSPRENIHTYVRLRFMFPADPGLKQIGDALQPLGRFRNKADYDLAPSVAFATSKLTHQLIRDAAAALALLDAIDADPARRAAAGAAVQRAFP